MPGTTIYVKLYFRWTTEVCINNGIWYKDKKHGEAKCFMYRNCSGRMTSIQSIFDAGHEELKTMSISGHDFQAGIRYFYQVYTIGLKFETLKNHKIKIIINLKM
nr:3312_t:CDS:2 [Entrophospora candida]